MYPYLGICKASRAVGTSSVKLSKEEQYEHAEHADSKMCEYLLDFLHSQKAASGWKESW